MPFHSTPVSGLYLFEPKVFEDERGYFFESFNERHFEEIGLRPRFVQDNQARSMRGVVRGLHYQHPPLAQGKLVRVLRGEILDVAVDIRKGSPTYGQHHAVVLNASNRLQLWVPAGFAHGYAVLSPDAEVFYKCDDFYAPDHEGGIALNDPELNIDWRIPLDEQVLSKKDQNHPPMKDADIRFTFE